MDAVGVVTQFLDRMAAHDWPGLGACVAEDVHRIGPFGDEYTGRDGYEKFLEQTIEALDGYELKVHRVLPVADGAGAFAELSETLKLDGERRRTEEGIIFDVAEGLITRVAVYLRKSSVV
ncbi:MAG: ketosteroid isomerase-like protein [Actinomycetia bacterium]|nr:ketosteroid isomerase-like protein [Actinomycetes bacterium]